MGGDWGPATAEKFQAKKVGPRESLPRLHTPRPFAGRLYRNREQGRRNDLLLRSISFPLLLPVRLLCSKSLPSKWHPTRSFGKSSTSSFARSSSSTTNLILAFYQCSNYLQLSQD